MGVAAGSVVRARPKQRDSWHSLKSFPAARGMKADPLGAGTALEVKCLSAIDSIPAVYRDDLRVRCARSVRT